MKKIIYVLGLAFLGACQNNQTQKKSEITATPNGMEGIQSNLPDNKVQSSSSNLAFNPEHGKPGHRCDLAVGAPLNGSANQVQQTPSITTDSVTVKPMSNPVIKADPSESIKPASQTNSKSNPAHGEPGHRCDVAVGAPLNSKAATVKVNQLAAPIVNSAKKNNAKLNPAHGEPGHRCDVAVGAPLS